MSPSIVCHVVLHDRGSSDRKEQSTYSLSMHVEIERCRSRRLRRQRVLSAATLSAADRVNR